MDFFVEWYEMTKWNKTEQTTYKVQPEDDCVLYSDGSLGINLSNPETINNIMRRLDESKELASKIKQCKKVEITLRF